MQLAPTASRSGLRMPVDPNVLPLRVAERAGRLLFWAIQLGLPKRERDVVLWLIVNGDRHLGTDWSCAGIADTLNAGEKTVRRALGDLEKRGLVSRQERRHTDGTRNTDWTRLMAPPELMELRSNAEDRERAGSEFEPLDWNVDLNEFSVHQVGEEDRLNSGAVKMTGSTQDDDQDGLNSGPVKMTGRGQAVKMTAPDSPSSGQNDRGTFLPIEDLEREGVEGSAVKMTGRRNRRGGNPASAADVFSIGGDAA